MELAAQRAEMPSKHLKIWLYYMHVAFTQLNSCIQFMSIKESRIKRHQLNFSIGIDSTLRLLVMALVLSLFKQYPAIVGALALIKITM